MANNNKLSRVAHTAVEEAVGTTNTTPEVIRWIVEEVLKSADLTNPGSSGWQARRIQERAQKLAPECVERWNTWVLAQRGAAWAARLQKEAQKRALLNQQGRWELQRSYGSQHFGSGGGWGKITYVNCRPMGRRDDGFTSGARYVQVIDLDKPAYFLARGGDALNWDQERTWSEEGVWDPNAREWVDLKSIRQGLKRAQKRQEYLGRKIQVQKESIPAYEAEINNNENNPGWITRYEKGLEKLQAKIGELVGERKAAEAKAQTLQKRLADLMDLLS